MGEFLKFSDADLIERKTEELYLSERNAGDENLTLTVLLPMIGGKKWRVGGTFACVEYFCILIFPLASDVLLSLS